jgi:hypothetical protein
MHRTPIYREVFAYRVRALSPSRTAWRARRNRWVEKVSLQQSDASALRGQLSRPQAMLSERDVTSPWIRRRQTPRTHR